MSLDARPARIGIIGCGNIFDEYARNSPSFSDFQLVACADINRKAAATKAAKYGLSSCSVDELLGDDSIEIILN